MRAKRRTDKEIAECKRKKDKHKPLPEGCLKADTSQNIEGVEKIIEEHRKLEKTLFPMRINAQTVIYVTAERNNEEYRRKWMKKNGYKNHGEKKIEKIESLGGRDKMCFDKEKAKSMLLEAFSVKEISNEVNVSTTILYHFFGKNGISIPNCKERIRILKSNGLSLDEIKKRMKIDSITVEKLYRNL